MLTVGTRGVAGKHTRILPCEASEIFLLKAVPASNPGEIPTGLKKLFQLVLVSLGCLHLAGGPYSLIQVYAWAGMLVNYTKTEGLLQGAKDTFSGEKPCELCCKISEARKGEPAKKETPLPSPSFGRFLQDLVALDLPTLNPPRSADYPLPVFPGMPRSERILAIAPALPPPKRVV